MNKIFINFLGLFFLFFVTIPAFSINPKADRNRWLQEELKLSPGQRVNIKKHLNHHTVHIKKLRDATEESRRDLRLSFRSFKKGRISNNELLMKFENYRSLKTQWQRARFMMALDIREELTDEQLLNLHTLKDFSDTEDDQ